MLRLIDAKADQGHRMDHNQNVTRTVKRAVRKLMAVDTRYRAEVVVEEIGA